MTVQSAPSITLGQAAVLLAERGYHVFPCRPRGKQPLTSTGFKEATRDERTILHWWDRTPDANIGIACGASGIVVLDIDSKNGGNPRDILDGSRRIGDAPIVLTSAGPLDDDQHPNSLPGVRGAHVYFRGDIRTTDLSLPGCEIRGDGGYVVAPPSLHPTGAQYGPTNLPHVNQLPETPDWLTELVGQQRANGPAAPVDEIITAGGRNAKLASLAGTMRRRGLDAPEIAATLHSVNDRRCQPPLPTDEVDAIAKSIARYAPGKAANGTPPKFKPLADDAKAAARILGDLLDLNSVGMHITGARVYGKGSSASLEVDISNNETLTFATLREMMRPQALIAEVAACTGAAPNLKQVQCAQALTLARQIATVVDVDSDNDIAKEWGSDFLDIADVLDLDINDQAQRWAAFDHLAQRDPWGKGQDPREPMPMPLVLRHLDGSRFIRTLWFERYVKQRDGSISRTVIGPRMARVGWQRRGTHGDIKATSPSRGEVKIWPFWVVPAAWGTES